MLPINPGYSLPLRTFINFIITIVTEGYKFLITAMNFINSFVGNLTSGNFNIIYNTYPFITIGNLIIVAIMVRISKTLINKGGN